MERMSTNITAWYNDKLREETLKEQREVYYYMVHATQLEERRHWAQEYTRIVEHNTKARVLQEIAT